MIVIYISRYGPSLMPGGHIAAWPHIKDIFQVCEYPFCQRSLEPQSELDFFFQILEKQYLPSHLSDYDCLSDMV